MSKIEENANENYGQGSYIYQNGIHVDEEADYLDDISSNEFSNIDEHELSGGEKADQNPKALDLTHQTNEDDLTPE